MSRIKSLLLLSASLLAIHVPGASATVTYAVGGCLPNLPTFLTISDALAATPAADVVEICAGTYPEKVFIENEVTLEGVAAGGSDQVVIAVPENQLLLLGCTGFTQPVQVCIQEGASGGASVNLSNIIVDGTGASNVIGIAYRFVSGTLNHIETRFQEGESGTGIELFEAATQLGESPLIIENSTIQGFGGVGINDMFSANVEIKGSTIAALPGATAGIQTLGEDSVTISGNIIDGPSTPVSGSCTASTCMGIFVADPPQTGSISGNTIIGADTAGVALSTAGDNPSTTLSVTSNKVFDSAGDGILISAADGTMTGNTITQTQYGVDFGCTVDNSVSSNTISASNKAGLGNVPSGVTSANTYFNVPTLSTAGCP